jgi:hypothetical protein
MKTVTPGGFDKSRLGLPYIYNNGTSSLPRPVIVSPDSGSIVRVGDLQLTWNQNPGIGATGWYEVQVSIYPNYPNNRAVTNQFETVSSLFNPNLVEYSALSRWLMAPWLPGSRLPKPDRYYWRVRSGNSTPGGVVYGQWSDTSRFVGDPLPDEYTFSLTGNARRIRMSGFTGGAFGNLRIVSRYSVKPSVETRISQRVNAPISARSIENIGTVHYVDGFASLTADLTFGQWSYIASVISVSDVVGLLSVRHDRGDSTGIATTTAMLSHRASMSGYVIDTVTVRGLLSKYPEDFLPVGVTANAEVSGHLGYRGGSSGHPVGVAEISATLKALHSLTCAIFADTLTRGRIGVGPGDFADVEISTVADVSGDLAVVEPGPMRGMASGYASTGGMLSGGRLYLSVDIYATASVDGSVSSPQPLGAVLNSGSFNYSWMDIRPLNGVIQPSPPWYEHVPGGGPEVAPFAIPEQQNWSIGPSWGRHMAYLGAHTPSLLPDLTGTSEGSSRLLRYLLNTSGISYQILSEFRADYVSGCGLTFYSGDHGNGDALDISGRSNTVLDYQVPTSVGQQELDTLARWVRQYPQLFTTAIYSSANPALSVQIRNGSPHQYSQEVLKLHRNHIHLASSLTWLRRVLSPPDWMRQRGETLAQLNGALVIPVESVAYVV